MISIEIDSLEEFENLNLEDNSKILDVLIEKYPKAFKETYDSLKELHEEVFNCKIKGSLFNYVSISSFIDEMDDFIEDEVIVNYCVKDLNLTDRGTERLVFYNGYRLLV